MSNSVRPHGWQPTRLPRPWDFPGLQTCQILASTFPLIPSAPSILCQMRLQVCVPLRSATTGGELDRHFLFLPFLVSFILICRYEAGHRNSQLQMDSTLLSTHGQLPWPVTRKANAEISTRVWTRTWLMCLPPGLKAWIETEDKLA